MKLNENYILKTVAGAPVVMPVGDAVNNIHGMIKLNAPAEIIWKALEKGLSKDKIIAELSETYKGVPEETLSADFDRFLNKLRDSKILED